MNTCRVDEVRMTDGSLFHKVCKVFIHLSVYIVYYTTCNTNILIENVVFTAEENASNFEYARVHTPNFPLVESELQLGTGDLIYDLEQTPTPGMWKVLISFLIYS